MCARTAVYPSALSSVFRNGGMTFAKSIDGWDRFGKSSPMCLSWPLQQAPLPCMRLFSLIHNLSSYYLLRNRVQNDIVRILGMEPDRLFKFVHPFNRPNLFYEVQIFRECLECGRLILVVGPVPFVRGRDNTNGRGLELHQWSAPSTRTTIHGHHLLPKPRDM